VEEVRGERQALFDRWLGEQTKDQELWTAERAAREKSADAAAARVTRRSGDAGSRPAAPYRRHLGPQGIRSGG
jgi:hypothetical protein